MEQIERIKQMEQRLERAAAAVIELSAALEKYAAVQKDIRVLDAYYFCIFLFFSDHSLSILYSFFSSFRIANLYYYNMHLIF